jgi:CDP-glucose 4,6-dehydratase
LEPRGRALEGLDRVTVDPTFWAGRRVLITGHTGFKGAWLALWLSELGAFVSGFALPPGTDPALFRLARVAERVTSTIGDLRDRSAVSEAVAKAAPDIIFHLAAQSLVIDSVADPVGTMETNVMGTVHLLQALRDRSEISAVLVVTSDKVYANDESGTAFPESFPLGGKDPYSASKAAAELVVRAFRATYFAASRPRLATARGGNVIGGGDYAARIIPDVVRALGAGVAPVLRMPDATRPWQHVLDCLAGYIVYAQALSRDEIVPPALNFGPAPHDPITVGEVATTIMHAFGAPCGFEHRPVLRPIEMQILAVDARLARETLRWEDRLPGRQAIEWAADWYRRVRDGADPLALTLEQINAYGR